MVFNPYLHYPGTCGEALQFYEQTLGAKVLFSMTYDQSPMAGEMPERAKGKIMHARFIAGGNTVLASDDVCGNFEKPAGFRINITVDSPEEAETIYNALSEGGEITMKLEETFWAKKFGMFTDKFGIPWMINCEKPMS